MLAAGGTFGWSHALGVRVLVVGTWWQRPSGDE